VSGSTPISPDSVPIATNQRALWLPGLAFAAGGAAAAALVAVVADALGVSLEMGGDPIPFQPFAVLAFVFSVVGIAMAAGFRQWSSQPARMFLRTTLALVAVSFLPDLLTPDVDAATRATLALAHIVVATIVITGLHSRLR